MPIRNRQPTVSEICAELDNPTAEIGFMRNVRDGNFHSWAEPPELYIQAFGAWLRADGSYGSFALNGHRTYGRDSRRALRAAVDRWAMNRVHAPSLTDIMKTINRIEQPPDWDGTFNGALAMALLALQDMRPEIPK
jgi:hypothetical protein